MNIDNYNDYFNYKIKTVYQYSVHLSKILGMEKNKLWHKKKDIENSLNYIIKDYFNNIKNKKGYSKFAFLKAVFKTKNNQHSRVFLNRA